MAFQISCCSLVARDRELMRRISIYLAWPMPSATIRVTASVMTHSIRTPTSVVKRMSTVQLQAITCLSPSTRSMHPACNYCNDNRPGAASSPCSSYPHLLLLFVVTALSLIWWNPDWAKCYAKDRNTEKDLIVRHTLTQCSRYPSLGQARTAGEWW